MKPEDVEPMIAAIAGMQKALAGHLAAGEERQFLDLVNALRGMRNKMIVAQWEQARKVPKA